MSSSSKELSNTYMGESSRCTATYRRKYLSLILTAYPSSSSPHFMRRWRYFSNRLFRSHSLAAGHFSTAQEQRDETDTKKEWGSAARRTDALDDARNVGFFKLCPELFDVNFVHVNAVRREHCRRETMQRGAPQANAHTHRSMWPSVSPAVMASGLL